MRNYLRVMYSVGRRAYSFDEILSLVLGHSVRRSLPLVLVGSA